MKAYCVRMFPDIAVKLFVSMTFLCNEPWSSNLWTMTQRISVPFIFLGSSYGI